MARLIAALIRHGDYHQLPDTPSAHQPFPLTATGEQQAREAAGALAAELVSNGWVADPVIDASRMLRAWQTAAIFADALGGTGTLGVESFDALAERGVGCAANLSIRQIEDILREDPRVAALPESWKADSHYCLPLQGAESLMQAGQRVAGHLTHAMSSLQQGERDCLKVFVGHGAAFRHAACHMGVLALEQVARLSMFHCRPILLEFEPDGQWRHVGGDWKVREAGSGFDD